MNIEHCLRFPGGEMVNRKIHGDPQTRRVYINTTEDFEARIDTALNVWFIHVRMVNLKDSCSKTDVFVDF